MNQIENEWLPISSQLRQGGAPPEIIREYRGIFLTGMLAGLDIKLISKRDIKEAVSYLQNQLGELMLMEVSKDAKGNH